MVINTICDFDEAVVVSVFIRRRSYRFRSFGIIISRSISIDLIFGQLVPFDGIAGDISCIMAESNGICFIRRRLIANGRAIFRGDDCLMASSQRIIRIFASGTASYTD